MNPGSWAGAIAFLDKKCIGSGSLREVARAIKALPVADQGGVLIFDAITSEPVELDLRGSIAAVLKRLPAEPEADMRSDAEEPRTPRTRGRPKLGVIAREVTLLPRHWTWLAGQPGGASVALRKLVEHALRAAGDSDRLRTRREAAYRFMSAMAGDEAGFEEAARALFADDREKFGSLVVNWPQDVRKHVLKLVDTATPDI